MEKGADLCKICNGDFLCSNMNGFNNGLKLFNIPFNQTIYKFWNLNSELLYQIDACEEKLNNLKFKVNSKINLNLIL